MGWSTMDDHGGAAADTRQDMVRKALLGWNAYFGIEWNECPVYGTMAYRRPSQKLPVEAAH